MIKQGSNDVIQDRVNTLNGELLGVNFKIMLTSQHTSPRWYMYTLHGIYNNTDGTIKERIIFQGRPEAVLGYLQGFENAMFVMNNTNDNKR